MTIIELRNALDNHCLDMKRLMPGFLYYGILSCKDGEVISSANNETDPLAREIEYGAAYHLVIINQVKQILKQASTTGLTLDNVLIQTDKIDYIITLSALGKFFSITALRKEKANLGISRKLLADCKAEFGTMLDEMLFRIKIVIPLF